MDIYEIAGMVAFIIIGVIFGVKVASDNSAKKFKKDLEDLMKP